MIKRYQAILVLLAAMEFHCLTAAEQEFKAQNSYEQWKNGPPTNSSYFPIAVWLQNPQNAERYRAAGINLYIALWRGPTEEQLAFLRKAGTQVICRQNQAGLTNKDDPII